ncbi:MAG: hypothetical protein ABSD62_02530 [Candidatus Limnocylindrales bacterium]|jgi:hypothetical protein
MTAGGCDRVGPSRQIGLCLLVELRRVIRQQGTAGQSSRECNCREDAEPPGPSIHSWFHPRSRFDSPVAAVNSAIVRAVPPLSLCASTEINDTNRTARTHVSNILGRLGLASRTQAALYAVEHDLVPKAAHPG